MLGKESIGPAVMIDAAAAPATTRTTAQDTAQPHSNPAVHISKGVRAAVLKVLKPSFQRSIHVQDDDLQAITVIPLRLLPDRIPQFCETLSPRPSLTAFEVIPQKIKTTRLRRIHDSSLLRMQDQSGFRRPVLHHL